MNSEANFFKNKKLSEHLIDHVGKFRTAAEKTVISIVD